MAKYLIAFNGSIEITPEPPADLQVTTTFLPDGQVDIGYSATLTATGGTTPYTWEAIEALPPGLSVSGSTVVGTPTTAGAYTPRLQVTDHLGAQADSGTLPMTIVAAGTALTITTNTIPNGQVGVPYSKQLTAIGGTQPYTWSVLSGTLPLGLSLDPVTGLIDGEPEVAGTSTLTFRVTDDATDTADSGAYQLVISAIAGVLINTVALPDGEQDVAYTQTIAVSGGSGSYTLSVTSGALPSGLSIAGMTITGTPDTIETASFTLQAVDDADAGLFDQRDLSIEIVAEGTVVGPHDYYESLAALSEFVPSASRTLRSQSQLNSLTNTTETAGSALWQVGDGANHPYWTYDPDNDTHAEKQDACKLFLPRLRKLHTCTDIRGKVKFTGTTGTVVPRVTLQHPVTGYQYRSDNAATIVASTAGSLTGSTGNVVIRALTPVGELYKAELPEGTVLDFVTPVAGVDATAKVSNAVIVRCTDLLSSPEMIDIPIGLGGPNATSADSVIYVWDVYHTHEFRVLAEEEGKPLVTTMKAYKPKFGDSQFGNEVGWTLYTKFRYGTLTSDPQSIGAWSQYSALGGATVGYTADASHDLEPTGEGAEPQHTYQVHWGVWTRYWMEIKFKQPGAAFDAWGNVACVGDPLPTLCTATSGVLSANPNTADGTYMMISIWMADENRDAVPVAYRVPATTARTWAGEFTLEFGVSDTPSLIPPGSDKGLRPVDLTLYLRNFATLYGYTLGENAHLTDSFLFARPVRG